jgi:hypothetical protein
MQALNLNQTPQTQRTLRAQPKVVATASATMMAQVAPMETIPTHQRLPCHPLLSHQRLQARCLVCHVAEMANLGMLGKSRAMATSFMMRSSTVSVPIATFLPMVFAGPTKFAAVFRSAIWSLG